MTLYLIGAVVGLSWAGYVFYQAWLSGEMDWKMFGIIVGCILLGSWLSYGTRGYHDEDGPAYCGSGPTAWEC